MRQGLTRGQTTRHLAGRAPAGQVTAVTVERMGRAGGCSVIRPRQGQQTGSCGETAAARGKRYRPADRSPCRTAASGSPVPPEIAPRAHSSNGCSGSNVPARGWAERQGNGHSGLSPSAPSFLQRHRSAEELHSP